MPPLHRPLPMIGPALFLLLTLAFTLPLHAANAQQRRNIVVREARWRETGMADSVLSLYSTSAWLRASATTIVLTAEESSRS